jgi:hypothetical protein
LVLFGFELEKQVFGLRVIEGEDIVFVRKIYGVWLCQPSALGVA